MLRFNLLGGCYNICHWSTEFATNCLAICHHSLALQVLKKSHLPRSHKQRLAATFSHKQPLGPQPLAATCRHLQSLAPQPEAATCPAATSSHLQRLAATCSHLPRSHKQPLAATCSHWQVAASGCFFENQIAHLLRPQCFKKPSIFFRLWRRDPFLEQVLARRSFCLANVILLASASWCLQIALGWLRQSCYCARSSMMFHGLLQLTACKSY